MEDAHDKAADIEVKATVKLRTTKPTTIAGNIAGVVALFTDQGLTVTDYLRAALKRPQLFGQKPATIAANIAGVVALFTDQGRQSAAIQVTGPYVVLAVAGYADGRPASTAAEPRDSPFLPASQLATAVVTPLSVPQRASCEAPEFTC